MKQSLTLVAVLALLLGGCHKVPEHRIRTALTAQNASFKPNLTDTIPLSERQKKTVQRIVAKFRDRSAVTVDTHMIGLQHGHFLLAGEMFLWQGSMLYITDGRTRNWVVTDPVLDAMANAYMKARERSPYGIPTEAWQQILAELERNP